MIRVMVVTPPKCQSETDKCHGKRNTKMLQDGYSLLAKRWHMITRIIVNCSISLVYRPQTYILLRVSVCPTKNLDALITVYYLLNLLCDSSYLIKSTFLTLNRHTLFLRLTTTAKYRPSQKIHHLSICNIISSSFLYRSSVWRIRLSFCHHPSTQLLINWSILNALNTEPPCSSNKKSGLTPLQTKAITASVSYVF